MVGSLTERSEGSTAPVVATEVSLLLESVGLTVDKVMRCAAGIREASFFFSFRLFLSVWWWAVSCGLEGGFVSF